MSINNTLKLYGTVSYTFSDKELSSDILTVDPHRLTGNDTEGYFQLEKIILTKDVTSVKWNGLGRNSFSLFEVSSENLVFQAIDGVLYTKMGYNREGENHKKKFMELVACPTRVRCHEVAYGTKRIGNCAFKDCLIEELVLPNTLEEIGANAFYFANRLQSIAIPKSIKTIEPQKDGPYSILFDSQRFDTWKALFDYLLNHGFEMKNHRVVLSRIVSDRMSKGDSPAIKDGRGINTATVELDNDISDTKKC